MDVSIDSENQQQLKKLLISVKVNLKRTGLLLAICDDINLRSHITEQYETQLKKEGVDTKRVWIETEQPSLYHILSTVQNDSDNLIVTVFGANELRNTPLKGDKSEQDEFFFSLQWTRESLLQFKYPIILWLTDSMATRLAQQSPDFWSWRDGIFEFQSMEQSDDSINNLEDLSSIAEYQEIASKLEKQNSRSPLLIPFYNRIGEDYQNNGDLEQGLDYYRMALELAEEHQDVQGKLLSLENLRKVRESIDNKDRINEFEFFHEIHSSELPLVESYGSWYRINNAKYSSLYFSRSGIDRFSSHELGILYVASDLSIAVAEVFRLSAKLRYISMEFIQKTRISMIEASCPLVFADFTGNGLSIIGQDILALYGKDYDMSKHLAKAVWSHPMNVHGIKYRSRYDLNRFNYVIFDRAARYLSEKNTGNLVDDHPQLLRDILDYYNLKLDSSENPLI
jgi:tetratricopeptide (TPR) repeat protein